MGHRLSKIYTRTGDQGSTGLANGTRVLKTSLRVEAMGAIDELNSWIGVLASHAIPDALKEPLSRIQHTLFDVGAELCLPEKQQLSADVSAALEQSLDELNADLPYLKEFILPGGSQAAAFAHLARSVCRRAEICLWRLQAEAPGNPDVMTYINRLSDWLFVAARVVARHNGGQEVFWKRQ